MDTMTRRYRLLHDRLSSRLTGDAFTRALAWCEAWLDAEGPGGEVADHEAVRQAVAAYQAADGAF